MTKEPANCRYPCDCVCVCQSFYSHTSIFSKHHCVQAEREAFDEVGLLASLTAGLGLGLITPKSTNILT